MPREHHSSGDDITIHKVQPRELGRLEVVSKSVDDRGSIADVYSAYHDNISPPLSWTRMLDAESFALILEDPDAPRERPFLHWMIWNLPGSLTELPPGVPAEPTPREPPGAIQGMNDASGFGYFGPRPPPGHGVHRYHFQLFALDIRLPLPPTTSLPDLLNALRGNTIADAELVGLYEAPARQ